MGQYHRLVNFDKLECVSPHGLGYGAKQGEHTSVRAGLSDCLYVLMAVFSERAGGDLSYDEKLEEKYKTWGRWAGDRVAVVGDYTNKEDIQFLDGDQFKGMSSYINITNSIIPALELAFEVKIYSIA